MYYTYIILSLIKPITYTGLTSNLSQRLDGHNRGNTKSTKRFRPYSYIYIEVYNTKIEAKKRERYWKSGAGRRKLKKYFNENDLN